MANDVRAKTTRLRSCTVCLIPVPYINIEQARKAHWKQFGHEPHDANHPSDATSGATR